MNKLIKTTIAGLVATAGGLLGSFAGADKTSKAWRRYGIPCLLTSLAYGHNPENMWYLSILTMIAPLSFGYGMPGKSDPKPSKIGSFWLSITKGKYLLASALTRATIGSSKALTMLVVPILRGNWLVWGICGAIMIASDTLWGTIHPKGTFKFLGKDLLWEEFLIYFGNVACGLGVIFLV